MTPELWLILFGVVLTTALCMVALGDAGRPVVPRRGPVRRELERRESSIDQRWDRR